MHAAQNYIYIVFAVLYIIYSIIKATKKASQQKSVTQNQKPQSSPTVQPPTVSPTPNPGDEMKKMLEDFLGGNPEVKIPEKQIPKLKPQPISIKPLPAKIITHAKKEKAIASHIPSKTQKPEKPFLTGDQYVSKKKFIESEVEEEPVIDFDIRQAIIYSEILKRPQY